MTITTLTHATKFGEEMAEALLGDITWFTTIDEYALYQCVRRITQRQSDTDDMKLRGMLHRIQQQLAAAQ